MIDLQRVAEMERALHGVLARAMDPGSNLPIDQWAEQNLSLSGRLTLQPGPLRLDRTPYVRGPLRAAQMSRYSQLMLDWAAQTAKTLVLEILMAHDVDQSPCEAMYAGPNRKFTHTRSTLHLQPFFRDCPILRSHITPRKSDMQTFLYSFDTMTLRLTWSGSPAGVAGEPVQKVYRDESAKWKSRDKDEAHPYNLIARRILSFDVFGRLVDASTPSTKEHPFWQDFSRSTWHRYWVPCPHCGKPGQVADVPLLVTDCDVAELNRKLAAAGYQVLTWGQFRGFTGERDPEKIKAVTYYECEHCKKAIDHSRILQMTLAGKWVPQNPTSSCAGFQLPSWYRNLSTTSFGAVAKRFIEAQGFPEQLRDVINSDFAEPFEDVGQAKTEKEILSHKRDYAPDTLPFIPLGIFLTADVREPEIHYVIRAWGEHETSALLSYGVLQRDKRPEIAGHEATGQSLAALDPLREKTFTGPDGQIYGVNLVGIDSGYDEAEVYAYCRTRPGCLALKGADEMTDVVRYSRPEKDPATKRPREDSCYLVVYKAGYYMDCLAGKWNITAGNPGEWMLHAETGEDYARQLTADRKVEVKNKFRTIGFKWKTFHKNNHLGDCEKEQIVLARHANIRDLKVSTGAQPPPQPKRATTVMGRDTNIFSSRFRR